MLIRRSIADELAVAVRINIVRFSKLNIIRFDDFMMFLPIYYRIFFSVFQIKI